MPQEALLCISSHNPSPGEDNHSHDLYVNHCFVILQPFYVSKMIQFDFPHFDLQLNEVILYEFFCVLLL